MDHFQELKSCSRALSSFQQTPYIEVEKLELVAYTIVRQALLTLREFTPETPGVPGVLDFV